MKQVILLVSFFLLINSIKNENDLTSNKGWETVCHESSCKSTLEQCIQNGCLGKASCKSCVEYYLSTCSKCVDDIYDESTQITLGNNNKTIICDANNQLHTTVCNFYCRSLFKPNFKCEVISNIPVCNCIDLTTTTSTTTTTATRFPTVTTTTTKKPENLQSNLYLLIFIK